MNPNFLRKKVFSLFVGLGRLVLQNEPERLEAGEDDLGDAAAALHVLHQDQGRNLQVVGVVGPLLVGDGGRAGEGGVAHVVKVELFHRQHWNKIS